MHVLNGLNHFGETVAELLKRGGIPFELPGMFCAMLAMCLLICIIMCMYVYIHVHLLVFETGHQTPNYY